MPSGYTYSRKLRIMMKHNLLNSTKMTTVVVLYVYWLFSSFDAVISNPETDNSNNTILRF